jgi:hypothetical protein
MWLRFLLSDLGSHVERWTSLAHAAPLGSRDQVPAGWRLK